MAWIQVRNDLPEDPRVLRVAHILKEPIERVIGCFIRLWIVGDKHTTDGRMMMPMESVDLLVGFNGFAAAAKAVDWLDTDSDGMCFIPRFKEKNGNSAKKRVQSAARQQKKRRAEASRSCHAGSVTKALLPRDQQQHQQQESERDSFAAQTSWVSRLAGVAADACPEVLLKACGVQGKPLTRLVRGGVTSERVRAVASDVMIQNGNIRNPAGLIASNLAEEFKVNLGKSHMLESDKGAIDALDKARARVRGGT
jgi:hypothetical protein